MTAPTIRLALASFALLLAAPALAAPTWKTIVPGAEYAALETAAKDTFHVVRVDPAKARLRAVMASALDGKPRSAGDYCDARKLAAAINLGMFLDDGKSNVGYARSGDHVNHGRWVKKYQSVLVWGPRKPGLPAAAMIDLDTPDARARIDDYDTAIQNLRLIKAPAQNAWGASGRKWSEAAVAVDGAGRVLFVFARVPHTMQEFNRLLLALPLDVKAAMHVEGGPEASLSVRAPGLTPPISLDLNGSFETGFMENESVVRQWPIPNVLAVERAR